MIPNLIHQFGVFVWKYKKKIGEQGELGVQGRMNKGMMQRKEWKGDKRDARKGERGYEGETWCLYLVSSCLSHPERRGATRRRRFVTHIDRFEDPLAPSAFDWLLFACSAVGF